MTIPFVIDNQQHKIAGVLNDLLAQHKGHSLELPPPTSMLAAGNCCVKGSMGLAISACCSVMNPGLVQTSACAKLGKTN
ncbi:MAG: hypothetical protein ACJ8DI_14490 [Ktedonobacteraceae bacterium]